MAEVLWNRSKAPYSDFVEALSNHYLPQLRNDGVRFSSSFLDPKLEIRPFKSGVSYGLIKPVNEVTFSVNNEVVTGIDIPKTEQAEEHRYLVHSNIGDQELRVCDYTFISHLALGKRVSFDTKPHEKYNHHGDFGLTDGVAGKKPWKGNEWLGFNNDTIRFTLDLETVEAFTTIRLETLNDPGSWIYRPERYLIQTNSNGKKFKTVAKAAMTGDLILVKKKMKARYVRVTIYNKELIPPGQTGAGFTPWTFINELILTR
jgi:hexosaminidase